MIYKVTAKVSKFVSFVSIVMATLGAGVFILLLPDILSSFVGRIFATLWLITIMAVIWTHSLRLLEERRHQRIARLFDISKEVNGLYKEHRKDEDLKKRKRGAYFNRAST